MEATVREMEIDDQETENEVTIRPEATVIPLKSQHQNFYSEADSLYSWPCVC